MAGPQDRHGRPVVQCAELRRLVPMIVQQVGQCQEDGPSTAGTECGPGGLGLTGRCHRGADIVGTGQADLRLDLARRRIPVFVDAGRTRPHPAVADQMPLRRQPPHRGRDRCRPHGTT